MVELPSIEIMVRRCAEIEDELKSIGAKKLIDEREGIKHNIKEFLIDEHSQGESFYDEVSNWEAVSQLRTKDEWDVEKLSLELSSNQQIRYITLQIDQTAIKEGISNGDLSRAKLESVGAVTKTPYSFALYVRERKIEDAPV